MCNIVYKDELDNDYKDYLKDYYIYQGCRGLMVKASGWQSFDRQFDPYPCAIKVAPLWCSLGCRSESDGRIHQ